MLALIALLSLAGTLVSLFLPGFSDLMLLAGPCLVASLWLVWRRVRAIYRRVPPRKAAPAPAPRHVIVDGSNVMHWQAGVPSLEPVIAAVRVLAEQGLTPGVIFDANVGYKTHDRYQDDHEMARRLGLPEDRVLVVPKGVPADQYILTAARQLRAQVVTNDRYRDWVAEFPEVASPGFLIRGGVKDGALWLHGRDLASGEAATASP